MLAVPAGSPPSIKCPLGSKLCKNEAECVLYSHVCDGEEDCRDGSDEEECSLACEMGNLHVLGKSGDVCGFRLNALPSSGRHSFLSYWGPGGGGGGGVRVIHDLSIINQSGQTSFLY